MERDHNFLNTQQKNINFIRQQNQTQQVNKEIFVKKINFKGK